MGQPKLLDAEKLRQYEEIKRASIDAQIRRTRRITHIWQFARKAKMSDLDQNFVYKRGEKKFYLLKTLVCLMMAMNFGVLIVLCSAASEVSLHPLHYMSYSLLHSLASISGLYAIIYNQWKLLYPLFLVLVPSAVLPLGFFFYTFSVQAYCNMRSVLTADDMVDPVVCLLSFPGSTNYRTSYVFLWIGMARCFELFIICKLMTNMERAERAAQIERVQESVRQAEESDDEDMVVFEKIPTSFRGAPSNVLERHIA